MRNLFLILVILIPFLLNAQDTDSIHSITGSQQILFKLHHGKAQVFRIAANQGASVTTEEEITILPGEKLITEESSRGEVKLNDGSIFTVNSGSVLVFQKNGMQLQSGELRVNLLKQGNEFHLATPATVALINVAEFIVKADKESTVINLLQGRLSVSDKIGNKVTLESGQAIKVTQVGFGAIVGFDQNIVSEEFEQNGESSGITNTLLNGNAMLVAGGLIIILLVTGIVFFLFRRKSKKSKSGPSFGVPAANPPARKMQENTYSQAPTIPVQKPAQAPAPKPASPPAQPVMFCSDCGSKLEPNAKFCNSCGTRVV